VDARQPKRGSPGTTKQWKLVLEWFDRSEEAAKRARADDGFLRMLADRRRALSRRAPEPRSA
jgi:hypothetical protein